MKREILAAVLLPLMFIALGFTYDSSAGDNVIGKWKMGKAENIIEIYKDNGKYFGKISELKTRDNDALYEGQIILKNFIYDEDEKLWTGGTVYAPKKNKEYKAELVLKDNNTLEIKVKAGMFGKSTTWTRAK
jgi:uncharacterized protein (DUF2147 family)